MSTYRVLATDPLDAQGVDVFRASPEIELDLRPGMPACRAAGDDRRLRRARHPQRHQGHRRHLEEPGRLRVIGRAGIGVDNVDVAAATKRGIVVMNTPGGNNVTTAEHAITMMLALAR